MHRPANPARFATLTILLLIASAALGFSARAAAASASPISPGSIVTAWNVIGNGSTAFSAGLLARGAYLPLWTATLSGTTDGASAQLVGGHAIVATASEVTAGLRVELHDILTGTLLCANTLPEPHLAPQYPGGRVASFAAGPITSGGSNDLLFAAGPTVTGAAAPLHFLAMDSNCNIAVDVTSQITPNHYANADSIAFADANGDGKLDIIAMYGNVVYPNGQPRIEVANLATGTTSIVVSDSFTGSGMTQMAVGNFTGDGLPDYVTGGWWGPTVAAYDGHGNRLWSGGVSSCSNADRRVLLAGSDASAMLFVGSGSYSQCSPTTISRVYPANGTTAWQYSVNSSARDIQPDAVALFAGASTPAVLTEADSVSGCSSAYQLATLSVQDGSVIGRACANAPSWPGQARAVDVDGAGTSQVLLPAFDTAGGCSAIHACLLRFDAHLAPIQAPFDLGALGGSPVVWIDPTPVVDLQAWLATLSALIGQLPAATAGTITPAVTTSIQADGGATRGLVNATGIQIVSAVHNTEANLSATTTTSVQTDGASTRSQLNSTRDASVTAVHSAETNTTGILATLKADLDGIGSSIGSALSDIKASLTSLRSSISSGFDRMTGRFDQVDSQLSDISSSLGTNATTEPLEVQLTAPNMDSGTSSFGVLVTYRGAPTDARLDFSTNGTSQVNATVDRLSQGTFVYSPPAALPTDAPRLLEVVATLDAHQGTAIAWLATPLASRGAPTAFVGRVTEPPPPANDSYHELANLTQPFGPVNVTTPGIVEPVVHVNGSRVSGFYVLNVTLIANGTPVASELVPLPDVGLPPIDKEFVNLPPATLLPTIGYNATVEVGYVQDSSARTCLSAGAPCSPVDPAHPVWFVSNGGTSTIDLHVRLTPSDGSQGVDENLPIPLAGQFVPSGP